MKVKLHWMPRFHWASLSRLERIKCCLNLTFLIIPVKNFPKKITLRNTFQKTKAVFLRKENVPKVTESVPKWNVLEGILFPLERVPSHSAEMERSRTYFAGLETFSIYFGSFSLLSNN